jgi:hypothetical protein
VDKAALGQVSFRVLRYSPDSIIPPLLHIHSCIIWGMDNGPVSGRSSTETQSYPVATVTRLERCNPYQNTHMRSLQIMNY